MRIHFWWSKFFQKIVKLRLWINYQRYICNILFSGDAFDSFLVCIFVMTLICNIRYRTNSLQQLSGLLELTQKRGVRHPHLPEQLSDCTSPGPLIAQLVRSSDQLTFWVWLVCSVNKNKRFGFELRFMAWFEK